MLSFLSQVMQWSLKNRAIVLVATLLLVAVGVRSALTLPLDAVPDVTNIQVQVITSSPALAPVEIEQYVTVPIERAMAGVPMSTEVRSISKYGISVVTIVFHDGTDIHLARQLVGERLREATEAIPNQYGKPVLGPITTGLGEVYQFVLRGEGRSLMELEETLDWVVAPQLRQVPGVIEVNSFGGQNKEYQVVLDPRRLQAAGLAVEDVARALERTNANAGGGFIERNREQLVIGTDGLVRSLDDLKSVVIGATPEGVPITVAHVGDAKFGPRLRRGAASMDAKGEVVVGVAMMLMGENSRTVTEAVKQKVAELQSTLPKGMQIEAFYDRGSLVDRIVGTVLKNLLEGALLVVLVLLLLLGDVRAGLIVAATIPLSMLVALTLMNVTGQSGNLMSLGAIDFGLIVDAAVIIVENAVRRLAEARTKLGREPTGDERTAVVGEAALEVRGASVFGEAIIAIVYVPVLALRGVEGKLFRPMATTVLFALLGAFILSVTVVPVLSSLFLRAREHRETWLMRLAHRLYRPLLDRAVRRRVVTLVAAVAVLVAGGVVLSRLGSEFVPQLDEGDLLFEVRRLPGISLTESIATDQRIQRALLTVPEVKHVVSKTGAPELAVDPMGIEQTDVYIHLKDRREWRKGLDRDELGRQLSEAVEKAVPEVAAALSQPIQMRTNELLAGVRSDVAAIVYGPDLTTLERLANELAAAISKVPGADEVRVEAGAGLGMLRVKPDRARLARYGLTVEDVNQLIEATAVGHQVGTIFEGDRRFDLVVKLDGLQPDEASFRALPLRSTSGQVVPLGDVAQVVIEKGPALVNRERQSRRRLVELNVRGRDLLSVVSDAQAAAATVPLPEGYRVEWGGQFEQLTSARTRLLVVVPLALALILFMLWLAFSAWRPAATVLGTIPFAVVGGVFALALRGMPFSISAAVGFIALFGVAVLNGLVLVSFARESSMREAAELRLRPVLMTAFVAALGFLPMALSSEPGSEVQRPLATVVIGGLVTATALTLLVLPALFSRASRTTG